MTAVSDVDRDRGVLAGVSPVAKLGASLLLGLFLILTVDWVSAAVALALELALLPLLRLPPRRLWLRALPIAIAAVGAGTTILLYGRTSGEVHAEFLLARISDGSIELAVATAVRVLAIALPAVLLFVTVDPTELADGLAQTLRLPARFVVGALAGVRLAGLFVEDWRALELARRARGVGDRSRVRRLPGQAFALLVLAVRRGGSLATAMEARGFGAPGPRTWARPARFDRRDVLVVAVGGAVGALADAVAIAAGTWNPLVG